LPIKISVSVPEHYQVPPVEPGFNPPSGRRAFVIAVIVIAAAACLAMGLTQPVIKLTRLYFWTDTHSLTSVIQALYHSGEVFLAAVIFTFSILFPVFKLLYIAAASTVMATAAVHTQRMLRRIEWLGKWSMLDVLVLALLVFYVKSTGLADAIALPGIYFFAASVILTMLAYGLLSVEQR
jgi:paraquat-inducible protein A